MDLISHHWSQHDMSRAYVRGPATPGARPSSPNGKGHAFAVCGESPRVALLLLGRRWRRSSRRPPALKRGTPSGTRPRARLRRAAARTIRRATRLATGGAVGRGRRARTVSADGRASTKGWMKRSGGSAGWRTIGSQPSGRPSWMLPQALRPVLRHALIAARSCRRGPSLQVILSKSQPHEGARG